MLKRVKLVLRRGHLRRQILRVVNVVTFGRVPFSSIYVLQVLVVFDFQKKACGRLRLLLYVFFLLA